MRSSRPMCGAGQIRGFGVVPRIVDSSLGVSTWAGRGCVTFGWIEIVPGVRHNAWRRQ
jgi:hypothetical protein